MKEPFMSNIIQSLPEFYRDKLENILKSENSDRILYIFDINYFLDIYRLESTIAIKYLEAVTII